MKELTQQQLSLFWKFYPEFIIKAIRENAPESLPVKERMLLYNIIKSVFAMKHFVMLKQPYVGRLKEPLDVLDREDVEMDWQGVRIIVPPYNNYKIFFVSELFGKNLNTWEEFQKHLKQLNCSITAQN